MVAEQGRLGVWARREQLARGRLRQIDLGSGEVADGRKCSNACANAAWLRLGLG